jgi:catechol 2,3-dioxygenase-like lactoylglutathione lyase family enzyme
MARLEHINLTVSDARRTAAFLEALLGWRIRWQGEAINGGFTVHVGEDDTYLALYTPKEGLSGQSTPYVHDGALNHIGLVVDDLDAMEARVADLGYTPHKHANYEPGRRFYFDGPDGVEYEMVAYA